MDIQSNQKYSKKNIKNEIKNADIEYIDNILINLDYIEIKHIYEGCYKNYNKHNRYCRNCITIISEFYNNYKLTNY